MTRGFTMVPNALVCGEVCCPDGSRISFGAQALYVLILHYSRYGERFCTVSQATLGEHLDVTARSVRTWLRELEECGLVRYKRSGSAGTNRVTPLLLPQRKPGAGRERTVDSDKEDAQGEQDNSSTQGNAATVVAVRGERAL
jgi:DNA-binding transcriptional ArsR family regulator